MAKIIVEFETEALLDKDIAGLKQLVDDGDSIGLSECLKIYDCSEVRWEDD